MNKNLICGDMLIELDKLSENSIDCIVTDPPYELGFMGRSWDKSGIAFQADTWKKCIRVLKPGGYMLCFGGSRTFHRIACAIEDAGFEIRDTIMWLYGTGFPKSMNISKQIDEKGGNDYSKQFSKDLKRARESRNLTMKYCDDKYCNGSTNWSWYEGRKNGCRVPDYQTYLEIIKDFPELEKYKELIKEAEREVIGKKEVLAVPISDQLDGWGEKKEIDITAPATDLAKQWQGWGTSLKPSFEPIIVARKPLCGIVTYNVITYGVGGINIDECRVPYEITQNPATNPLYRAENGYKIEHGIDANPSSYKLKKSIGKMNINSKGRFPSNVILTYDESDYDEVCGGFPYSGSGNGGAPYNYAGKEYNNRATSMFNGDKPQAPSNYNDSGSACRYFYCAKASKRDRNDGLDDLETNPVFELVSDTPQEIQDEIKRLLNI